MQQHAAMQAAIRPSAASRLRCGQAAPRGASSALAPARAAATARRPPARQPLSVRALAQPSARSGMKPSMDRAAALERLYLSSSTDPQLAAAVAAAAAPLRTQQQEALQHQQEQQQHHPHQVHVLSAEEHHVLPLAAALQRADATAAAAPAAVPAAHAPVCHLQPVATPPGAAVAVALASTSTCPQEHIGMAGAEGDSSPSTFLGRLLDAIPVDRHTRGIIMLNLLVLLVATNWVVVKDVGASFDPFGFAFLRFAVAAAAFSPFMRAASKDKTILRAGMEIGMWTAAGYITQSIGLLTTDASRASFLSTFTVLVVPFLAGLSGRGVSMVTWASCLTALVGVGLLEQGGAPPGVGDIWSFLSAVAFGVQVFRTEHWARILGNGSNMGLMSVVLTTTMGFSALAAGAAHPDALAAMAQNPGMLQDILTSGQFPWQQVLYCGLLTTDLALLMEVFALQDVSSVEAAIIYTLEPVLGAGFAWMLLGERLGARGLAGAALILASSVASQVLAPAEGGDSGKEKAE